MPKPNQQIRASSVNAVKKPRPHTWIIKDAFQHELYHPWQARKAQAKHRKEEWELTFDEFFDLWKDDWHNRGKLSHNVCMTRIDPELPWNKKNTVLVTRYDHLTRQRTERAK